MLERFFTHPINKRKHLNNNLELSSPSDTVMSSYSPSESASGYLKVESTRSIQGLVRVTGSRLQVHRDAGVTIICTIHTNLRISLPLLEFGRTGQESPWEVLA